MSYNLGNERVAAFFQEKPAETPADRCKSNDDGEFVRSRRTEAAMDRWESVFHPAARALSATAAAAPLALVGAGLFVDPVEVVGRPLVDGYSERAESAGWMLFLVASFVVALAASRANIPPSFVSVLAASMIALPLLAIWPFAWWGLALYVLAAVAGYGNGRRRNFTIGVVGWSALLSAAALDHLAAGVVGAPILAIASASSLWSDDSPIRLALRRSTSIAAALAVFGFGVAPSAMFVAGAVVVQLGSRCQPIRSIFVQWPWAAVALVVAVPWFWLDARWEFDDWSAAAWLGSGVCWAIAARSVAWPDVQRCKRPLAALVVAALIAGIAWRRPWALAALLPVFLAAVAGERRTGVVVLSAFLFPIAFLFPGVAPREFDVFHDAQVLSAVQEFNRGRALYSEVFPLRSFEFYLAAAADRTLGASATAFWWTAGNCMFLSIPGVYLTAFFWTRSLPWSLAFALAAVVPLAQDGRTGLHFWFATAGLAMLRSRSPVAATVWMGAGVGAAVAGYDFLVPFAAASVVGLIAAGRMPLAGAAAILSVAPWTMILCAWQGVDSALAYWRLLLEYALYYPAMYGLPLDWREPLFWPTLSSSCLTAGAWAAGLGVAWRNLAPARRGMAAFLVVQFALAAQRALGRSDAAHLECLGPFVLVWSLLGLWAILRAGGVPRSLQRMSAFAVALGALVLTPHGRVTPVDWYRGLQAARHSPSLLAAPDPTLAERLQRDDVIWDLARADAYLIYRRSNPTRHALAYCIPSPAEQKAALDAMQRTPPKLIFWRHDSRHDPGAPDIANPLRYYLIAPWVYRNYRPIEVEGRLVLEPAPPNWAGFDAVDAKFGGPLDLGWLAKRWGAERLPKLRVLQRRPVDVNRPLNAPIRPRDWNYLVVAAVGGGAATAKLEWGDSHGAVDSTSYVNWRTSGDGRSRRYLVPIACSPGWSWRSFIGRLQISAATGDVAVSHAELLHVDESAQD